MSNKKNASNNPIESQSYFDDSYQNSNFNQVPFSNNISLNLNNNIISNSINQSISGDENSIGSSTFNPSYLNMFNIPNINEIERPTNIGTKEEKNKESTLKSKSLFIIMKPGRKKMNIINFQMIF